MDCPCPSCTLQRLNKAVREIRKILLEESHKLDVIAHAKGIPEEYHSQIENISTRIIEPLTLIRKAYLMPDWTKFDEAIESDTKRKVKP